MKNLIFAILSAAVILCSCSKDDVQPIGSSNDGSYNLQSKGIPDIIVFDKQGNQSVHYEVKDGRLILANSDDFEDFLHILSTHDLDEWEQSISFQSYRTAKELEKNRIYAIRKSKKPLQQNKSSITMHTTFNYILGPPQGNQTLNAKLNNF